MDQAKVTEYVERFFELYGLNKKDYFYTESGQDEIELRSPFPEKVPAEKSLRRLSVFLGLTVEEIVSMDKRAALKYWIKYPFFALYNEFLSKWIWNAQYKSKRPKAEDMLLSAIFNVDLGLEERYNWLQVHNRLLRQLEVMAAFDPDYYLEGRELEIRKLVTAEFFSFPRCSEMIRDYIRMVNRVQELFFKAVKQDLSVEEMNEYNFLVSYFDVSDVYRPSIRLYYHVVVSLRDVIKEEGHTEFWSYGKINYSLNLEQPWRCVEFFDDMSLVQEYVNLFPSAKKAMTDFAMLVRNFSFTVRWKKTEEEKDEEFVQAYLNDEDYDPERSGFPSLHVYVPKTEKEIRDYESPLLSLEKAASPPSMGGVKLPVREQIPGFPDRNKSIQRRFGVEVVS